MKSLLTSLCLLVTASAFGANFPYIRLNNKTNRLSDSGSALTFNGSPVSVFPGIVSNSVVTSGLLAVGAGKTNGIAATPAHIVSTLGFTPANSNSVVNATAGSVINTVASAGLLSVDSSKTNGIASTFAHVTNAMGVAVSQAQFGYLSDTTGEIGAALNGKQPLAATLTAASTNTFTGTGVIPLRSVAANSVGGVYQPFDLSKTYIVVLGDSLSQDGIPNYSTIAMNYPQWQGILFYTNISLGGETLIQQTNKFYTNLLPILPATVVGTATNVIVSIFTIGNDIINWGSTSSILISNYSVFLSDLKSRGYKVLIPTPTPRSTFGTVQNAEVYQWINWLKSSSNLVDYVPDFYSQFSDGYDTNMYSDAIHFTGLAQTNAAVVWDDALRYPSRPVNPHLIRTGQSTAFLNTNGTLVATLTDAGVLTPLTGFRVQTSGSGYDMFQMNNSFAGAKTYYMGGTDFGVFNVRNTTTGDDIISISENATSLTNGGTNRVAKIGIGSGVGVAGFLHYRIIAGDATQRQVASGILNYATAVNSSFVATMALSDDPSPAKALTSGTLTWTFITESSGSNSYIDIAAVSSLTTTSFKFRFFAAQSADGASLITPQ